MKRPFVVPIVVVFLILTSCNFSQDPILDPIVGTWNLTSETSNGAPIAPVPNIVLTMKEYGYSLDLDGLWSEVNRKLCQAQTSLPGLFPVIP